MITLPPKSLHTRRTGCHSAEQGTSIKLQSVSCRGVVRPRKLLHRRSCIACGGTLKLSSFATARRNAYDLMVGMTMSSWSARAGFDMVADDVRAASGVVHCAACCSSLALQSSKVLRQGSPSTA